MIAGFANIDRAITSFAVGFSRSGGLVTARFDKLSVVSDTEKVNNREKLGRRLDAIQSRGGYIVKKTDGTPHYQESILVWPKGNKDARLLIEYRPWAAVRGYVRLELSPQYFGPEEIDRLFAWLARPTNLGRRIYRVLAKAWITRLDFAVDVYGHRLRDTFIGLEGARKGETTANGCDFDGQRLGGVTSPLHASFYEKVRLEGTRPEVRRNTKLDLRTVDHRRFSRVEVRWRPDKGEKPLSQLNQSVNLLDRVRFYSLELEQDSRLPDEFRRLLGRCTIPEAFGRLEGDAADKRNKRDRISRILRKYECQLFNTEEVLSGWFGCVEQLGILGRPQDW